MSLHTNIGYCDSSVNCTSGCTSQCEIRRTCYARKLHEERLAKALPKLYAPDFTEVRLIPGRMAQAAHWSDLTGKDRPNKPWLNGRPRHIFISDMSDALSEDVPFEYLYTEIFGACVEPAGRRHVWLWLTKQPQRMVEFAERWTRTIAWPNNLWAGTSVTNQATADLRIPWLLKVPAKVRFVSYEPALGMVDFSKAVLPNGASCHPLVVEEGHYPISGNLGPIHWVIIGGESGPDFRPLPVAWVRMVAEQCRAAGVKVFVKQSACLRPGQQGNIPDDLWALKEMPD